MDQAGKTGAPDQQKRRHGSNANYDKKNLLRR
jgi:hypothetical protein